MTVADRVNDAPTPGFITTLLVMAAGDTAETVTPYVNVTAGVVDSTPCHFNIGAFDASTAPPVAVKEPVT
jgi:hypothetical protein